MFLEQKIDDSIRSLANAGTNLLLCEGKISELTACLCVKHCVRWIQGVSRYHLNLVCKYTGAFVCDPDDLSPMSVCFGFASSAKAFVFNKMQYVQFISIEPNYSLLMRAPSLFQAEQYASIVKRLLIIFSNSENFCRGGGSVDLYWYSLFSGDFEANQTNAYDSDWKDARAVLSAMCLAVPKSLFESSIAMSGQSNSSRGLIRLIQSSGRRFASIASDSGLPRLVDPSTCSIAESLFTQSSLFMFALDFFVKIVKIDAIIHSHEILHNPIKSISDNDSEE